MSDAGMDDDGHELRRGLLSSDHDIYHSSSPLPASESFRISRWSSLRSPVFPSPVHGGDNDYHELDDIPVDADTAALLPSAAPSIGRPESVHPAATKDDECRDNMLVNLVAAGNNMLFQSWSFEHMVVLAIATTSTISFCVAHSPNHKDEFAARIDLHFLFHGLMFLFSYLARVTFSRREASAEHIAKIKSLLCQIEHGLLLWNRTEPRPSLGCDESFDDTVHLVLVELAQCFFRLLQLPTLPEPAGTNVAADRPRRCLAKRIQKLRLQLTVRFILVHYALEDCKQAGALTCSESNRLADYIKSVQVEMERVHLLKCYRTPQSARQFVTAQLLFCPCFWGVYFSQVRETAGFTYTLALSVISIIIPLLMLNVMRAMEDPFISQIGSYGAGGDNIEVQRELKDSIARLGWVRRYCAQSAHLRRRPLQSAPDI